MTTPSMTTTEGQPYSWLGWNITYDQRPYGIFAVAKKGIVTLRSDFGFMSYRSAAQNVEQQIESLEKNHAG